MIDEKGLDEVVKAAWREARGPLVGASDGQTYVVPALTNDLMRDICRAAITAYLSASAEPVMAAAKDAAFYGAGFLMSNAGGTIERIAPADVAHPTPEPPMSETFDPIIAEVDRAMRKFPTWPTDPLHALAVLGEEFGELTKEALQLTYEPHKSTLADFRKEAIQTAAMALRFVASLDEYKFSPGVQHSQAPVEAPNV